MNTEPDQIDPNAYLPDTYNDREGLYYKSSVLGAIRAIDYLFTRADFDGENLCAAGVSQGAGLAIITAGIDDRVNLLLCSNPALSEHSGMKFDKATGFPYYIFNSRAAVNTEQHETETILATQYYDAIHFAKRYNGPALMIISYEDIVTPAATSFATFNELSGMKLLVHAIELGHNQPNEYWSGRINMIRRYYEAALTPPIPNNNLSQGYFADAGVDQTAQVGLPINLSGYIEDNGTLLNIPMEWSVTNGTGKVVFSNPNALKTTVTFSAPGIYKLRLRGDDDVSLASDDLLFSIFDEIVITVSE